MYVIKNSYPMFVQLNKENQFKEKYLLKVLRLSSRLNIIKKNSYILIFFTANQFYKCSFLAKVFILILGFLSKI